MVDCEKLLALLLLLYKKGKIISKGDYEDFAKAEDIIGQRQFDTYDKLIKKNPLIRMKRAGRRNEYEMPVSIQMTLEKKNSIEKFLDEIKYIINDNMRQLQLYKGKVMTKEKRTEVEELAFKTLRTIQSIQLLIDLASTPSRRVKEISNSADNLNFSFNNQRIKLIKILDGIDNRIVVKVILKSSI